MYIYICIYALLARDPLARDIAMHFRHYTTAIFVPLKDKSTQFYCLIATQIM